jgi:hypothetical protein
VGAEVGDDVAVDVGALLVGAVVVGAVPDVVGVDVVAEVGPEDAAVLGAPDGEEVGAAGDGS